MDHPPEGYRLVLTTAGSEEQALEIARGLVERRLAACVNVIDHCCSIYRWKGEIVEEEEKLLLVKTEARRVDAVRRAIRELHSYDVPEVIALPLTDGDASYLAWVSESLEDGKTAD